jgi:hypothetical protein
LKGQGLKSAQIQIYYEIARGLYRFRSLSGESYDADHDGAPITGSLGVTKLAASRAESGKGMVVAFELLLG